MAIVMSKYTEASMQTNEDTVTMDKNALTVRKISFFNIPKTKNSVDKTVVIIPIFSISLVSPAVIIAKLASKVTNAEYADIALNETVSGENSDVMLSRGIRTRGDRHQRAPMTKSAVVKPERKVRSKYPTDVSYAKNSDRHRNTVRMNVSTTAERQYTFIFLIMISVLLNLFFIYIITLNC